MAGEIENFTGISASYETPETAELTIKTASLSVEAAVEQAREAVEGVG